MKNFYLFRHAKTVANEKGFFNSVEGDTPLSEEGIKQAEEIVKHFKDVKLDVVVSSKTNRAIQTAERLAKSKGAELVTFEDLKSASLGEVAGLSKQDFINSNPIEYARWHDPQDLDFAYKGGESKRQVQGRVMDVLNELAENTPFDDAAVVMHGSSLRSVLEYFNVLREHVKNVEIFHIVWEDGKWDVR
jgi:broad specificity phosphatase PhoE